MPDTSVTEADGPQPPFEVRPIRHFHRDYQHYDAVKIETMPRWKESYLSGDEWRFSARVCFMSKGKVVAVKTVRDVEAACKYVAWGHATIGEESIGNPQRHELIDPTFDRREYCDQEGCGEKHTVTYQLKALFSREGYRHEPTTPHYACFCDKHKNRGDCGLEDAMHNYEIVERDA